MAQNDFFMTSNLTQDFEPSQAESFVASDQNKEKNKPIEVIDIPQQAADQEFNDYTRASQALKQKVPTHLSEF